jgi:hypothetical protein
MYDRNVVCCLGGRDRVFKCYLVELHNIGQGEAQHRKYKSSNLVAIRHTTVQVSIKCCYILR